MSRTGAKEKVSGKLRRFTTKTAEAIVSIFFLFSCFFFLYSHLGLNYQHFLEEMKDGSPSASDEVRYECLMI